MRATRRIFLKDAAIAMAGVGSAPFWLARTASASGGEGRRRKVLVAIFLRGAADGLNLVVPFFERSYYQRRPTIAVPPPGKPRGALDLDGKFGLHPSLSSLKSLWDEKSLAIVHAAGSPDPTRSHFDAQDYMESGTPGRKSIADGWLNRALPTVSDDESPLRALATGQQLPRILRGENPAVALSSLRDFDVRRRGSSEAFQAMYTETADAELSSTGRETFEAIRLIKSIHRQPYVPEHGAKYPRGRFGPSLEQIAQLIKANVGLEVAFADLGGWDHHFNESPQLTQSLRHLGDSLAAFRRDLGDRLEDVVVVTMSEFGRTVNENGNLGTDHGHGNVMFAFGGPVEGGRLYGAWPGLEEEQLHEGRDLVVATDFREVLSELVNGHLGVGDLSRVFPGFQPSLNLNLLSRG